MIDRQEPVTTSLPEFFFPQDGSEIWLKAMDAELALLLLRLNVHLNQRVSPTRVLEIGVWRGAWSSVMLVNVADAVVYGVDPYPGYLSDIRGAMLQRLRDLGVEGRFVLSPDLSSLTAEKGFDMIHVDGEHSEAAVWSDLSFARNHLAPGGVIVVDDYRHPDFPGIASALFRFLETNNLRIFLVTPNKAYLASPSDASSYHESLLTNAPNLRHARLRRHFGEGDPEQDVYRQSSDVLGQPVLLAEKVSRSEHSNETTDSWLRRALRAITPPVFVDAYRFLRWGSSAKD